jgi:cyclin C
VNFLCNRMCANSRIVSCRILNCVLFFTCVILLHVTDIKSLGAHAKVRQRVIATAIAYFRRVYTRKSFSEYDPYLVAPTCLYLASKAEESTVQAKLLVFYMKKIRDIFRSLFMSTDDKAHRYDIKDVLEMEMRLLEALDYYLVIYHPYRPLVQLLQDASLTDITPCTWCNL